MNFFLKKSYLFKSVTLKIPHTEINLFLRPIQRATTQTYVQDKIYIKKTEIIIVAVTTDQSARRG